MCKLNAKSFNKLLRVDSFLTFLSFALDVQDDLIRISPPDGGSPIFVKSSLTAGLMTQGVPIQQAFAKSAAATRRKSAALLEEDIEIGKEPASSSVMEPLIDKDTAQQALRSKSQKVPEVELARLSSSCLILYLLDELHNLEHSMILRSDWVNAAY